MAQQRVRDISALEKEVFLNYCKGFKDLDTCIMTDGTHGSNTCFGSSN